MNSESVNGFSAAAVSVFYLGIQQYHGVSSWEREEEQNTKKYIENAPESYHNTRTNSEKRGLVVMVVVVVVGG